MAIRVISRTVHAVLDYLSGTAMLASPWLFGFADIPPARNILVCSGIIVIGMSLLTNYEGGVSKKIAMSTHLWGDLFLGIFLATSPWLFFFDGDTYMVHLLFGLLAIAASLLTVSGSQVKRHGPIDWAFRKPQR